MKPLLFSIAHELASVGLICASLPELLYHSPQFSVVLSQVLHVLLCFVHHIHEEGRASSVILLISKIWNPHGSGNVIQVSVKIAVLLKEGLIILVPLDLSESLSSLICRVESSNLLVPYLHLVAHQTELLLKLMLCLSKSIGFIFESVRSFISTA